jgi:hypothetical protein
MLELGGCAQRARGTTLPRVSGTEASARAFDLALLAARDCHELIDADSTARAHVFALYEHARGHACVYRPAYTIEGEATRTYLVVDDGRALAVRDHPRDPEGRGLVNQVDRCTLGPPPSPSGYCSAGVVSCIRLTCWTPDVRGGRFVF